MSNPIDNLKPFEKGQSGNLNGRPKGTKNRSTIARHWLEANQSANNPLTGIKENLSQEDLIQEAKKRGYRKGTAIRYVPHAIDYVEGNYFEVENEKLNAYAKPKHERKGFDDYRHDTLFDGEKWVEIVDPSKRSDEQKAIDDMHNVY